MMEADLTLNTPADSHSVTVSTSAHLLRLYACKLPQAYHTDLLTLLTYSTQLESAIQTQKLVQKTGSLQLDLAKLKLFKEHQMNRIQTYQAI